MVPSLVHHLTGRGRDREGLLVKPDLPEGRYRVVARGRGGGAGEAEVTVPREGEARYRVELSAKGVATEGVPVTIDGGGRTTKLIRVE